jgi:hypothetical protein
MNDTWSCINVHQRSLALALTGSTQYSHPSECRMSQRSSMNLQIYIIDRISNKTSLPASLMQTMPHLSHATNHFLPSYPSTPSFLTRIMKTMIQLWSLVTGQTYQYFDFLIFQLILGLLVMLVFSCGTHIRRYRGAGIVWFIGDGCRRWWRSGSQIWRYYTRHSTRLILLG